MKFSYFLGFVGLLMAMCGCSKSPASVDYVAVKMDGDHWSLMDKDGEIICQDEFSNCPTAVVEGMFFVQEGNGYSLYKAGDKPEAVGSCQGLSDYGYFNDGLCLVTFPGERISIINTKGEKVATFGPINGHEVEQCFSYINDDLILAKLDDDTFGYLNKKGEKAIDFKYNTAYPFNEGLAIVKKDDKTMVINTSGETVFKILDEIKIVSEVFVHGYIFGYYKSDNRWVIIDEEGTITKCPSSVEEITAFDGTYFIFKSEREYGLMALKDMETVVRAKYKSLVLLEDGNYLAEKDDYYIIINAEDEELHRISDYDNVFEIGSGFGLFAEDHDNYSRIDYDGKAKDKNTFKQVACFVSASVESDFFDYGKMASTVIGLIKENGVGKYQLGASPSTYFSNPSRYRYTNTAYVELDTIGKQQKLRIFLSLVFDENMANYQYDYHWLAGRYNERYSWNDNSKLYRIAINVQSSSRNISDRGAAEVASALVKQGFKLDKQTPESATEYATLLTKDNMLIFISAQMRCHDFRVEVYQNTESFRTYFIDRINNIPSDSGNSDREVVDYSVDEVCDSCAVDSCGW